MYESISTILSCIMTSYLVTIYAAGLTVEFSNTEYTLNEQETGVFLLGLSTSADRNVSVVLTTSDQSARSKLFFYLCCQIIIIILLMRNCHMVQYKNVFCEVANKAFLHVQILIVVHDYKRSVIFYCLSAVNTCLQSFLGLSESFLIKEIF